MPLPPTQPLRFDDFSGGITDEHVPGQQNKYLRADNLLVTLDKQLETRAGSRPMNGDDSRVVGVNRVGSIIFVDDQMIAQHGPDLSYPNASNVFTALAGPTGNPALGSGGNEDVASHAEWRKHLILTNSDTGSKPVKVFLDSTTSTWKAWTLGLPLLPESKNYSDSGLLNQCLALANNLKAQLLAHMADSGGGVGASLHQQIDAVNTANLTAIADATDAASLYTLCAGLQAAYDRHRVDIARNIIGGAHYDISIKVYEEVAGSPSPQVNSTYYAGVPLSLNMPLVQSVPVSTSDDPIYDAAIFLNDLRQKYYWHTWCPMLHDPTQNRVAVLNRYQPLPAISTPSSDPIFTPRWDQYIALITPVQSILLDHLSNVSKHYQADARMTASPASTYFTATNFDSWVVKLAHLRASYWMHWLDSVMPSYAIKVDTTATSATVGNAQTLAGAQFITTGLSDTGGLFFLLTSATPSDGSFGTNYMRVLEYLADSTGAVWGVQPPLNYVTSFGFGSSSFIVNENAGATVAGQSIILTYSLYHWQNDANRVDTALAYLADGAPMGFSKNSTTLSGWVELFNELVNCLDEHTQPAESNDPHLNALTYSSLFPRTATRTPTYMPLLETQSDLYSFCYLREYTVGGVTYQDRGPVKEFGPIESCPPHPSFIYSNGMEGGAVLTSSTDPTQLWSQLSGVQITNIPTYVNAANENYDTSTLKLEIYRTTNNGTTSYLLTTLDNGTTSYNDELHDTDVVLGVTQLSTRTQLYTTGGVVDNDPPPTCKYVHVLNTKTYFGAIWDGTDYFPRRIRESIADDPDAAPGSFYVDLDSDLVGISSAQGRLIALCKEAIYRIESGFTETGSGELTRDKIAETVGCVSSAGIVQTDLGVFFPGKDGFYWTDGYQVKPISDFPKTYASITRTQVQRDRISGSYDPLSKRVWWSVQSSDSLDDVDLDLVLDLNYPIRRDSTFTTVSGGSSFRPTAIAFQGETMYRGTPQGYILKHHKDYSTDVTVDTAVAPSSWAESQVAFDFVSCATDFGQTMLKKWVPRMNVVARNYGSLDVNLYSINDNQTVQALKPINYTSDLIWGTTPIVWGTTPITWSDSNSGIVDEWRHFKSGGLRCEYKQIRMTSGTDLSQRFRLINYTLHFIPLDKSQSDYGGNDS